MPDHVIRQRLLSQLPLGSSMDDAAELVKRRGWELTYRIETHGFLHQGTRPSKVVGAKHIQAFAGRYWDVFRVTITVYWGFDEQGRLIDVWVWKSVSGF